MLSYEQVKSLELLNALKVGDVVVSRNKLNHTDTCYEITDENVLHSVYNRLRRDIIILRNIVLFKEEDIASLDITIKTTYTKSKILL